jgi:hypothetical protein
MASSSSPEQPSRSKLRRLRAATTKHRLFQSANQDDPLKAITSQLAILTYTVDSLIAFLTVHWSANINETTPVSSSQLNADAVVFHPVQAVDSAHGSGAMMSKCVHSSGTDDILFTGGGEASQDASDQQDCAGAHMADTFFADLSEACASEAFASEFTKLLQNVTTDLDCIEQLDGADSGIGGLDEEPVADGATCCEWRAGGESPQQACDGDGDGVRVEEQGRLTAAQMCSLVDAVVNNLRESSKWQTMPPACASDVLAELKAPYEDGAGTVYTQRQALEIMEHTGRKCGDAFNLFQMALRDAPKDSEKRFKQFRKMQSNGLMKRTQDSEKRFKQFLKMQSNGLMKPASIEDE